MYNITLIGTMVDLLSSFHLFNYLDSLLIVLAAVDCVYCLENVCIDCIIECVVTLEEINDSELLYVQVHVTPYSQKYIGGEFILAVKVKPAPTSKSF